MPKTTVLLLVLPSPFIHVVLLRRDRWSFDFDLLERNFRRLNVLSYLEETRWKQVKNKPLKIKLPWYVIPNGSDISDNRGKRKTENLHVSYFSPHLVNLLYCFSASSTFISLDDWFFFIFCNFLPYFLSLSLLAPTRWILIMVLYPIPDRL